MVWLLLILFLKLVVQLLGYAKNYIEQGNSSGTIGYALSSYEKSGWYEYSHWDTEGEQYAHGRFCWRSIS